MGQNAGEKKVKWDYSVCVCVQVSVCLYVFMCVCVFKRKTEWIAESITGLG